MLIALRTTILAIVSVLTLQDALFAQTQFLDERFGSIMFSTEWAGGGIAKLKEIGTGMARGGCAWNDLEPSRGVFQWGCSDAWINTALNNNIRLYFGIDCTPGWANGNRGCHVAPDDWNDWYDFVLAFMNHYPSSYVGTNVILGFYNEPNLDNDGSGAFPAVDDCTLVGIAGRARDATNPVFILGFPETSFHAVTSQTYYAAVMDCINPYMQPQDVVTVHWYTDARTNLVSYSDAVRSHAGGHDVWLTEVGPDSYDQSEEYRQGATYANIISQFINSGRSWLTHIIMWRLWSGYPCCSTGAILRPDYSNLAAAKSYHAQIHGFSGAGAWDTTAPGWVLVPDQSISSPNGRYRLLYQSVDGNLVLYDNSSGQQLWASNTNGTSPGRVLMQGDGDLVILDRSGNQVWHTNTSGNGESYATVQDDSNFVVYRYDGFPLWWRWQ